MATANRNTKEAEGNVMPELEPDDDDDDSTGSENKNNKDNKDASISWDFGKVLRNNNITQCYFNKTLTDVYDCTSFRSATASQIQHNHKMLVQCVESIIKCHQNTMDEEGIASFKSFPNEIGIRFSDSFKLFDTKFQAHHLIGRAIRFGFYEKEKNNHNTESTIQEAFGMVIAYADNIPFVEDSVRFIGIKFDALCFESWKFALAEQPADLSSRHELDEKEFDKVHKRMKRWKDIALVVGISLINNILNAKFAASDENFNDYQRLCTTDGNWCQSSDHERVFDVSDLLPPFHDIQSLFKENHNPDWWEEQDKTVTTYSTSEDDSLSNFIHDETKGDYIPTDNLGATVRGQLDDQQYLAICCSDGCRLSTTTEDSSAESIEPRITRSASRKKRKIGEGSNNKAVDKSRPSKKQKV